MTSTPDLAKHTNGWSAPFWQDHDGQKITHRFMGRDGSFWWTISNESGWELAQCAGQFSKCDLENIRSLIDMMICTFNTFEDPGKVE